MTSTLDPAPVATGTGKTQPSGEQTAVQTKLLLTGRELASRLGVSLRTVEQWSSAGMIPKLVLSTRMTRYQLPKVLAAIEAYQTATLSRKK